MRRTLAKSGLPFEKATPSVHFPKALKRPRNTAGPASYYYYYSKRKEQSSRRIRKKIASTPRPGIKPGPPANAADALPLSYRGWLSSQPERLTTSPHHLLLPLTAQHTHDAVIGKPPPTVGPATVELHTAGVSLNLILIV